MSWVVIVLCLFSLHLQSISTVSVSFTAFGVTSTTQLCTSAGYADICCLPLDLDLQDGHGYGWFRASVIAFTEIEAPETVTIVYGSSPHLEPCAAVGILKRRQGNQPWQTRLDMHKGTGAGSASAISSFGPMHLRIKIPYIVVVNGVVYRNSGSGGSHVMTFRNQQGGEIHGRLPDSSRRLSIHNLTGLEDSWAPTDRSTS